MDATMGGGLHHGRQACLTWGKSRWEGERERSRLTCELVQQAHWLGNSDMTLNGACDWLGSRGQGMLGFSVAAEDKDLEMTLLSCFPK